MPTEPKLGDAFGELLRAAYAEQGRGPAPGVVGMVPRPILEIIERDDGLINGIDANHYLCPPDQWSETDRRALELMDGRTLDVGAGAGRLALALQERSVPVTALDISPGAVEVATARGVRHTVCATVDEHAAEATEKYDCFAFFGNNLALLESRDRAPLFLAALAAMAARGARIIAPAVHPYQTEDELHLAYHERNRRAGRFGGQVRIRVRYRHIATEWFDYLFCTPDELAQLVTGTPWRITEIEEAGPPHFLATLTLSP